jgi:hypothetical protein
MLYLAGAFVSDDDGWWLVAELNREARADAFRAALAIADALRTEASTVTLTVADLRAVLRHLKKPPSGLVGLRDLLLRDVPPG